MTQINQYPIQAVKLANSDLFDIDADQGGGVWESQKVTFSLLKSELETSMLFKNLGSQNLISSDPIRRFSLFGTDGTAHKFIIDNGVSDLFTITGNGTISSPTASARHHIGTGIHIEKLGGSLATDKKVIQNSSGTDLIWFRGNSHIWSLADHTFGDAFTPLASVTVQNSYGIGQRVTGASGQTGLSILANSKTGALPFDILNAVWAGDTTTNYGAKIAVTTGSVSTVAIGSHVSATSIGTNTAQKLTASGGVANIALEITAGDIKLPSTALGFTGTGAYTTLTIEKGIITNAI